jgi:hypothetical protein
VDNASFVAASIIELEVNRARVRQSVAVRFLIREA